MKAGNWNAVELVPPVSRGLIVVMGLSELQKCNGSGVRGPIIGLANMNAGVFRVGNWADNWADISLGLRMGTGDATESVVCTAGVTFKLSGFGFGLDDDVLLGDLFRDKFSAIAVSPELDVDDIPELEFEALINAKLLLMLASEFLIITALSCSFSSLIRLLVARCADDLILAAL